MVLVTYPQAPSAVDSSKHPELRHAAPTHTRGSRKNKHLRKRKAFRSKPPYHAWKKFAGDSATGSQSSLMAILMTGASLVSLCSSAAIGQRVHSTRSHRPTNAVVEVQQGTGETAKALDYIVKSHAFCSETS